MIDDYDQYDLSKKNKMVFGVCLFFLIVLCSILFYRHWILILAFPFLYQKGKGLLEEYFIGRRKKKMLLEFRDFLFSLSTSFSTGRHMTEGLKEAAQYLLEIHGEHGILQPELRFMIKAIEETGKTDLEVLSGFAHRVKLEDVYLFTDIFRACRETGGSLNLSMHKAAFMISEKINLENEMETMVYQKKLEGRMIALVPFVILLFLQWMSPGYLEVMYSNAGGILLMSLALLMTGTAYMWMERMTDVEL